MFMLQAPLADCPAATHDKAPAGAGLAKWNSFPLHRLEDLQITSR